MLAELGELVTGERRNPRFAEHGNVYSLWCARDVVAGGCYIVNSDVLFEDEVARRLVQVEGSAVLCSTSHGVDAESMKAVCEGGRLVSLSKDAPSDANPEYIGLARIDPAHGQLLARALDEFVEKGRLDVYYESAIEALAQSEHVAAASVDGLAWIEIDDHEDLGRARDDVLARVA
jgi:choline kinase